MSKSTTLIIIFVAVFLVIGIVVYMVMSTNKKATETTQVSNTTQTGLGNILSNTNPGILAPLIGLFSKSQG